jgi:hypothetical protein
MKTIKLIGFLLFSIIIQLTLLPFRLLGLTLQVVEKIISILRSTTKHLIEKTISEVLKK